MSGALRPRSISYYLLYSISIKKKTFTFQNTKKNKKVERCSPEQNLVYFFLLSCRLMLLQQYRVCLDDSPVQVEFLVLLDMDVEHSRQVLQALEIILRKAGFTGILLDQFRVFVELPLNTNLRIGKDSINDFVVEEIQIFRFKQHDVYLLMVTHSYKLTLLHCCITSIKISAFTQNSIQKHCSNVSL